MFRTLSLLTALMTSISALSQVYGDPIVQFDFADGIPESWENQSQSEIGIWEYRGPDTTPDNTVCSQGSCGGSTVPIASETLDNGFVIFDSNYWDDEIGPCGNLGSGQDPGPHLAWLRTESVDLTDYPNVVLTFLQQYRQNQNAVELSVNVSIDGGETWEEVLMNPTSDFSTDDAEWATMNISEIAGGQPDVRLEFLFDGLYYYWALDDITLYVPSQDDLIIENTKYNFFDGLQPPFGFGGMEYDAWPSFMIPDFTFSADITNVGAAVQTDVSLNVRVTDEQDQFIYSENTNPMVLEPGATMNASYSELWTPSDVLGDYTIRFKAEQAEADQTPLNNEFFKDYEISAFKYARDEGPMEDTFVPSGIYENEPYEIGNVFESIEGNSLFHAIGVGIAEPSMVGTEIYGIVYDISINEVIAQTDTYEINEWDINSVGEEKIISLPLQGNFITEPDTAYAVMVGINNMDGDFFVSRSGNPPPQTSLLFYPEQNLLFYVLKTPVVRMHLFPPNSTPGCTDETAENYNPNATDDDGSCLFSGCTNDMATNYDPSANFDDGSCEFIGCTDPEASNYDPNANMDDGSCLYPGCTDPNASNFDPDANDDDGSCSYEEAFLSADIESGCAPLTVVFSNQTSVVPDGVCAFISVGEFEINDCTDSFTHEFVTPGTYSVEYTYTVGDFVSTYTLGPIEVYEIPATPSASFDDQTNTLTCDGCDGMADINWYNGGVLIEGQSSSSWQPIDNGNYAVEIISNDGCIAISEEILVVITSVEENEFTSLLCYPNPAKSFVNLRMDRSMESVEVFNTVGERVLSKSINSNTTVLSLEDLSSGVYSLTVNSGNHRVTQKLIIE